MTRDIERMVARFMESWSAYCEAGPVAPEALAIAHEFALDVSFAVVRHLKDKSANRRASRAKARK